MDHVFKDIINQIYDKCDLRVSEFREELESKEYNACRFKLNGLNIISRNAKITPKKIGQFVTFWKRNQSGITEPLNENDSFDFYVINVCKDDKLGQFVIPKSTLINKGIISTSKKEGKRGFRVYPSWDTTSSKQAVKTQKWQLDYFVEMNDETNLKLVSDLYIRT
ncbi:MAG: MepB family protein [Chitinophagales bacterium]|nr:MepB family protein [Chitinophagales bacterium]